MISIKNATQIQKMRAAGVVLYDVLQSLRTFIKAGITTREVDQYAEHMMRERGTIPSFLNYDGFPASLCISIDDEVVHGIPGVRKIEEGMIVSVDGGVILDGWQSDSAFTVGIGKVTDEAEKLIRVTEESFFEALKYVRPGNRLSDIGHAVQSYVEQYGFAPVRALCGHGIGREMHEDPEVPNYGAPGRGPRLRAGMVLAIEPMIVAGDWQVEMMDDDWTVVTRDGSLCSHYEHTVLVTDGNPEILSFPGYKGGTV